MKGRLALAAVAAVLIAPASALATGHPPVKTPCDGCCGDLRQEINQLKLVFDQRLEQQDIRITNVENRISQLENTVQNLNNYIVQIDQRTTTIINRLDPLVCTSSRVYTYRLRTQVDGVPVTAVESVTVAGTTDRGSFTRTAGRFVIRADYRGITAPSLQFRTVMVHARLANGQEVDLVQYVRLCGEDDGDPNKTPAQQFAGR